MTTVGSKRANAFRKCEDDGGWRLRRLDGFPDRNWKASGKTTARLV